MKIQKPNSLCAFASLRLCVERETRCEQNIFAKAPVESANGEGETWHSQLGTLNPPYFIRVNPCSSVANLCHRRVLQTTRNNFANVPVESAIGERGTWRSQFGALTRFRVSCFAFRVSNPTPPKHIHIHPTPTSLQSSNPKIQIPQIIRSSQYSFALGDLRLAYRIRGR